MSQEKVPNIKPMPNPLIASVSSFCVFFFFVFVCLFFVFQHIHIFSTHLWWALFSFLVFFSCLFSFKEDNGKGNYAFSTLYLQLSKHNPIDFEGKNKVWIPYYIQPNYYKVIIHKLLPINYENSIILAKKIRHMCLAKDIYRFS